MTDKEEAPPGEPTIEEIAREEVAEALDRISSRAAGGKVHWSSTTIPVALRPVLLDLGRHLRRPMPKMPQLPRREPSKKALERAELRRREEERYRWTAKELGEAIREAL